MTTPFSSPADSLREELAATQALADVLTKEQSCLVNADVESLAGVSEEKARIVGRMTDLALRRHAALAALGFEASEAGMQVWLQSPQAPKNVLSTWNDLLDLAAKAKEANRVNGMLLGQHMARNQQALNILQGSNQPAGAIYGPNGQTTSSTSTRRLVVG